MYADHYADQYSVTRQTAYEGLKDACTTLFERYFTYESLSKKGSIERVRSRWVSEVAYIESEGHVKLIFAAAVVPLITNLERHFTSYELEQVSDLTSIYAIRLYELLIAWRSTGKTPHFKMADLRTKLGVEPEEYPRLDNFKAKVLDFAITQINAHTDITANYVQHKCGRVISGFTFNFKTKNKTSSAALVNVPSVGDSRKKITKAKAESMARAGESYQQLYARLGRDYIII